MQTKILLAVFTICFFVTNADAQIKKGAIFLGGNIGFNTQISKAASSSPDITNSNFNVSPVLGIAIKENLVLGFDLTYAHYKNESFNDIEKSGTYGAGIFIRKYKVLGKGFYLFGEGRADFSYTNNSVAPNTGFTNSVEDQYSISVSFYPGIAYAVTNKLQLEAGLSNLFSAGYTHQDLTASKANFFSINSSLSNLTNINAGVRFLLN